MLPKLISPFRKLKIEFLWINQDLGVCQRNHKLRLSLHTKSILTRNHQNSTKIPHLVRAHFDEPIDETFLLWVIFRNHNAKDQMVPNFSGWLLKQRENNIPTSSLRQTSETYLPPIVSKVSEFKTIESYFEYLETLSKLCNMPYTNITLDVGAAIDAFKFLWTNQTRFRNIVIHLGDFPFMKGNFQVSTDFYTFLF